MQDLFQERRFFIQFTFILASALLIYKCLDLQVLDDSYRTRGGFRQALTSYPSRGTIFDRNGKQLVNNQAIYDVWVTYKQVKNIDTTLFCKLLDIDKATFVKNLEKDWKRDRRFDKVKPYIFLKNISAEQGNVLNEQLYLFPGFELRKRNVRDYVYEAGAHAFGYISEINSSQLDQLTDNGYEQGDYLGTSGLELSYEPFLRGEKGVRQLLKDNFGRIKGSYKDGIFDVNAVSGLNLVTTLDIDLQVYGEQLMRNKKGAIVAIEPSTGEILAIISSPTYDPNLLTINRHRGEAFEQLSKDSLNPFFNRAMMAKYPPGSTFKPVMALIGLQEGSLSPERSITCRGAYISGRFRLGCHDHPHTGDVGKAIQYSCNNYFCHVFRDVIEQEGFNNPDIGLNRFVDHLYAFGLGRNLGLDVPNELKGNVPTTEYYNKIYKGNRWKSTAIISLAIGQGELEVTPMQMANMTAIIANKGYYYVPHLAKTFVDDDNTPVNTTAISDYTQKHYTKIDAKHFEPVIRGMVDVLEKGTGARSRIPHIKMGGKTGTVQNPHGENHSSFIAFAPADNPKIALAVYVENSGGGSTYAAPIASLMAEKYLTDTISTKRKWLETRMLEANLIENP